MIKMESRPLTRNVMRVGIRGEMNADSVAEMEAAFDQLLARGARDFVVDLGGVSSIDAAGLGVLVSIAKRVRKFAGDLKILSTSLKMKETLQCAGLTQFFRILENEKEVDESVLASVFPCLDCPLFVGIPNCPIVKSFAYAAPPCKPGPHLEWLTRNFKRIFQAAPEAELPDAVQPVAGLRFAKNHPRKNPR